MAPNWSKVLYSQLPERIRPLPDGDILGIHARMKNAYWIVVGAVVGFGAGAIYGLDYALTGAAIGAVGGGGIFLGMRSTGAGRNK